MSKPRVKMPPSQRAKQFAPFDALVGLRRALKEKERLRVPRKTVSDDMAEEINRSLVLTQTGDIITVVYYNESKEEYTRLTGKVTSIDERNRKLQIEAKKINFDDIYGIVGK